MVVVGRFSKTKHFGFLPIHSSAFKVTNLFTMMIHKLHKHLESVIFDLDIIFFVNVGKLCLD